MSHADGCIPIIWSFRYQKCFSLSSSGQITHPTRQTPSAQICGKHTDSVQVFGQKVQKDRTADSRDGEAGTKHGLGAKKSRATAHQPSAARTGTATDDQRASQHSPASILLGVAFDNHGTTTQP